MKIRLVQDHLRSGGTERQTLLLANAFHAAGHDTAVVLFRPGGALFPRPPASDSEPIAHRPSSSASGPQPSALRPSGSPSSGLPPLPLHVLQPFDTRQNWFAPGLVRTLRAADPDIVLCMGAMANCWAGHLQKKLPRALVSGTMRGGKPLPWLIRRSLPHLDHIVANSAEASEVLQRDHGVRPDRVSVIHNALVFPPQPDTAPRGSELARDSALRTEHGAGPATVVLLCVGMFRPEKNQRALVELAATLPKTLDWQLWFAGEGITRPACTELAARLGVGDRLRFLGFQRDPGPLYRAADLAVLASKAESLSNFLIESQAHGLPVVAADARGVSECIQPGVTGEVVPAGDIPAHRAALLPYLENPDLRARAGAAAILFARQAFEPARQARAYLDLFEKLRK
ncbi:MAG: glycosyltransferase [Opitutaceae bacterium]|jgi:glycosyltransferase involved in cell wall biosynthesis